MSMKVTDRDLVGEEGVALVKRIVNGSLGWLFREQLHSDVGIDAQIEPVLDERASGRLIAVQIKSGPSYFRERNSSDIVFRPDDAHVRYWLQHSLPVIVVLVDTETDSAYWQSVTRDTVVSTGVGWKVLVPVGQTLTAGRTALEALSAGDPYMLELRQLQLAQPWLEVLRDGGELLVDVDEWIHKSSGRAEIRLSGSDAEGNEIKDASWQIIFPGADYEEELPGLFPWARLSIDEEHYSDFDYVQFLDECSIWDSEDKQAIILDDFHEWRARQDWPHLRPYGHTANEVARWRLRLELNRLGDAFLDVDAHLRNGPRSLA